METLQFNGELEAEYVKRRRFPRVSVRIPVKIYTPGSSTPVTGEIQNISEGGAFIHCFAPVAIGQEIRVEIQFGSARPWEYPYNGRPIAVGPKQISENAVVRWARGSSVGGLGVEFRSLTGETSKAIATLVERLQP